MKEREPKAVSKSKAKRKELLATQSLQKGDEQERLPFTKPVYVYELKVMEVAVCLLCRHRGIEDR